LTLHDMRVLMTVIQAGSMGKAAKRLGTSQPARTSQRGNCFRADHRACAGSVFDDGHWSHCLADVIGERPGQSIKASARRKWDNEFQPARRLRYCSGHVGKKNHCAK
jgi:hypothetical protein